MNSTRFACVASLAAAAALMAPGAALAKGGGGNGGGGNGGGGGGGTTAPAPEPVNYTQCDFSLDGQLPDGGAVFSNQVGTAGCLSAVARNNTVRFYSVSLTPGWTYQVDTTTNGIRVTFTETATRHQATAKIEPGKTDIRG